MVWQLELVCPGIELFPAVVLLVVLSLGAMSVDLDEIKGKTAGIRKASANFVEPEV